MRYVIVGLLLVVAGVPHFSLRTSAQTRPNSTVQQRQAADEHVAWVVDAMKRMQTIRPGMTRKELLTVFTTEGGLSNRLQRTYVSRDCLYFKVDVTFQPIGQPNGDLPADRREDDSDVIVRISRPYLEFAIAD